MFTHLNKSAQRDWPLVEPHLTAEWIDSVALSKSTGISLYTIRNHILYYTQLGLVESRQTTNPNNKAYLKTLVRKKQS